MSGLNGSHENEDRNRKNVNNRNSRGRAHSSSSAGGGRKPRGANASKSGGVLSYDPTPDACSRVVSVPSDSSSLPLTANSTHADNYRSQSDAATPAAAADCVANSVADTVISDPSERLLPPAASRRSEDDDHKNDPEKFSKPVAPSPPSTTRRVTNPARKTASSATRSKTKAPVPENESCDLESDTSRHAPAASASEETATRAPPRSSLPSSSSFATEDNRNKSDDRRKGRQASKTTTTSSHKETKGAGTISSRDENNGGGRGRAATRSGSGGAAGSSSSKTSSKPKYVVNAFDATKHHAVMNHTSDDENVILRLNVPPHEMNCSDKEGDDFDDFDQTTIPGFSFPNAYGGHSSHVAHHPSVRPEDGEQSVQKITTLSLQNNNDNKEKDNDNNCRCDGNTASSEHGPRAYDEHAHDSFLSKPSAIPGGKRTGRVAAPFLNPSSASLDPSGSAMHHRDSHLDGFGTGRDAYCCANASAPQNCSFSSSSPPPSASQCSSYATGFHEDDGDAQSRLNGNLQHRLRKIRLLLAFAEKNKAGEWPMTTNVHCYWCCHRFPNHPYGLPLKYVGGKFFVTGCFCSLECAAAYNFGSGGSVDEMWERYSLLNMLAYHLSNEDDAPVSATSREAGAEGTSEQDVVSTPSAAAVPCPKRRRLPSTQVRQAPHRLALNIFGGHLSIDEFRHFCPSQRLTIVNFPPMMTLTQQIEEINDNDVQSMHAYVPIDYERIDKYQKEIKLKRSKPLISKHNTLMCAMNIRYTSNDGASGAHAQHHHPQSL